MEILLGIFLGQIVLPIIAMLGYNNQFLMKTFWIFVAASLLYLSLFAVRCFVCKVFFIVDKWLLPFSIALLVEVIFALFSLRLMGMGFVYLFGLWFSGVTRVITIPFAVFIINKLLIKYNLSD